MSNLSDIKRLRAEEKELRRKNTLGELRKEFDKQKRLEWQEIRAKHQSKASQIEVELTALRQQMARVAQELIDSGVSKTAIGDAYGTKDRKTINDLLDYVANVESDTRLTLVPDFEEDGRLPVWRVHASGYKGWTGEVTVYADEDGDPVVYGDFPQDFIGTELHQEIAGGLTGDFNIAWSEAF